MADIETLPPEARASHLIHVHDARVLCVTEERGEPKNRNLAINEIVVGINGMIPLWAKDVTLYWRFNRRSFAATGNPERNKEKVRSLLTRAIAAWGAAAPVTFEEREEGWDFEIVLRNSDDCSLSGCVLASAFFPDAGRHKLTIYPRMLMQSEQEQLETLIHELGHVFGLRHFFAKVSETQEPAEIFGAHVEFSIMNYGAASTLTPADLSDLATLYEQARSQALTAINGTPIVLVRPFTSAFG
jgi:hypothetical protein